MINTKQRIDLLFQAEDAYVNLLIQVNEMLGLLDFYSMRNEPKSASDHVKMRDMIGAIEALGSLPNALGQVIERWKSNLDPVYSQEGIEINILNELYLTLEVTTLFLIRENANMGVLSLGEARKAHARLVALNKQL